MYMYSRKNTVYSKDFNNYIAQLGTKNENYFYRENCAFFLASYTAHQLTFHFSIISDVYIDFIIVCAATMFTFPRTMEIKRTVFSARERSLAWDGILMRTLRLDSQYCNVLLMTLLALISISVVIVKHLLDSATALFVTIHIYFNVQAV